MPKRKIKEKTLSKSNPLIHLINVDNRGTHINIIPKDKRLNYKKITICLNTNYIMEINIEYINTANTIHKKANISKICPLIPTTMDLSEIYLEWIIKFVNDKIEDAKDYIEYIEYIKPILKNYIILSSKPQENTKIRKHTK